MSRSTLAMGTLFFAAAVVHGPVTRSVLAPAVEAAALQAAQTEAPVSAAGEWNINLEANQPQPFRGAMDQQGAKLTGYMGDEIAEYPVTGTVQGATITFTWSMFQRGEEIKLVVTGKLEKDTFTGTAKIGNYASNVQVTGQRTPPR